MNAEQATIQAIATELLALSLKMADLALKMEPLMPVSANRIYREVFWQATMVDKMRSNLNINQSTGDGDDQHNGEDQTRQVSGHGRNGEPRRRASAKNTGNAYRS